MCVYDRFGKPFNSYLGQNAGHNFITNMIKESKHCSCLMKKHFNKELALTKEDDGNFESSTNF